MKYAINFLPSAEEDIKRIKRSGNKSLFKKLTVLLEEISEHPKTGNGKPEQLKYYEISYLVTQDFVKTPFVSSMEY